MKVFIKGKGEIELNNSNYVSAGGEGQIYAKGSTAYKIYIDPKKMIPSSKIQELSVLTNPNIIKPNDILLDAKNKSIGYSMRYVSDTYALCQLFTKSFREREAVSPEMVLGLVRNLQQLIQHIHQSNILLVDLNELNFLTDKSFKEIFAIDVDSYQTPSFPATAIMENIRDRHSKTFNQLTDWFSFAVVSANLFLSIHPYKGKHLKYKSLEERMVNNISIFNKDVSIPSVCYPFDVIPQVYRDWLQAVLDKGIRIPPPNDLNAVVKLVAARAVQIIGNNLFDIKEIKSFNENILRVIFAPSLDITLTTKEICINSDHISPPSINNVKVAMAPKTNAVIAGYLDKNNIKLFNCSKRSFINFSLAASEIMEYNNRLYCKNHNNIIEILFTEIGQNIIASSKIIGNCLEQASHLYDGVLIQNLLGSLYVSIFPSAGFCYQIKIKELDTYRIIDAKFDNNVLIIVGIKNGKYDKFIIRFSETYDEYDLRITDNISQLDINFITLDNGVCIHITEDEKLEIFSNKIKSSGLKEIEDKIIKSDMKLYKNGIKVLFAQDNKLFSMKMK